MLVLYHARKPLESVLDDLPSDWEHSSRYSLSISLSPPSASETDCVRDH
jgi:hypothetical protein